jgi:hypothetical protein
MTRPAQLFAAGLAMASATAATAQGLHCLGTAPGFMLILEGATARFDYLGDGVFDVSPPLALPGPDLQRLTLSTFGGPLPLFVERAECEVLGITLAFSVEIGVQTSQGMQPMTGCCREAP